MDLLDRNPVTVGLVALALTAAVTLAALAVQRVHLVGGYELTAEFADAAGLRVGDSVLVAGVRAGEVTDLAIAGDRVEATLLMENVDLAGDATARIKVETLVGKRVVDLDAGSRWDEPLGQGDVIGLERTSVTTDLPEFGDEAEELLSEIDSEALNAFVVSLTDITRDQREEVRALIEGGGDLADVVVEQEARIHAVLDQLDELGETLNARDAELVAIIDNVDVALGRLNERRDDLRTLLRETRATTSVAADLVGDKRGELDAILTDLHEITGVLQRHQMDLAEGLAYGSDSILGFSSIFRAHGQPVTWGKVMVQSLGPLGIDTLVGCAGAIDQMLDDVFGPDPRTCAEQEDDSQPFEEGTRGPLYGDVDAPPEQERELDALPRHALGGRR